MNVSRADILVVGESVADVIHRPGGGSVTHPGGSPANVAYGLARLDEDVALLTQLGDDEDGALIRAHLVGAGVRLVAPADPELPTPRATARIQADGSAEYDFEIGWTLADPPPCRAPHVHTGSIAAFLSPGADTVLDLLEAARGDASISVDPNIRAALLGDHEAALARFERLASLADVVKASDEDLDWLYPGEDPAGIARGLVETGTGLVIVTRGADGATAMTRAGMTEVAAPRTHVADTVGAGDSFMAALLASLRRSGLLGPGLRDALAQTPPELRPHLDQAARAAAITVSRRGANPPTRDELVGR
ncbi:carbohydrate kinase family protein [Microbacterium phosphatis]|uniref:carbohydrate kinase family protein n=1 Tax=Microbacterium phosphatis TaxID=3140248 RepID=UPI00313FF1F1